MSRAGVEYAPTADLVALPDRPASTGCQVVEGREDVIDLVGLRAIADTPVAALSRLRSDPLKSNSHMAPIESVTEK